MNAARKMTLIGSFILFNLLLVTGNNLQMKENAKAPITLMNIPDDLPAEDLHEGLRVLTTEELKTLSKYIDDQSKRQTERFLNKRQTESNQQTSTKNFLGAMENYWTRHIRAAAMKKKRNIDDLYDEMVRDYAEPQIKNKNDDEFSEMEALGCTCRNVPNEWYSNNMRTKRENQFASNLEKGYSIEEYVRELENSFPRDQDGKEPYGGETSHKNHLRIKRL